MAHPKKGDNLESSANGANKRTTDREHRTTPATTTTKTVDISDLDSNDPQPDRATLLQENVELRLEMFSLRADNEKLQNDLKEAQELAAKSKHLQTKGQVRDTTLS